MADEIIERCRELPPHLSHLKDNMLLYPLDYDLALFALKIIANLNLSEETSCVDYYPSEYNAPCLLEMHIERTIDEIDIYMGNSGIDISGGNFVPVRRTWDNLSECDIKEIVSLINNV